MSLPHLSLADARNLHLAAQGLLNKPRRQASLEDIPATISRMSLLQIDTINIVARSPYLVLFSRLGNYPAQWLDESLARGELMEYWAHEACFMPRSDFRLIRHRMLAPEKMGWKYKDAWMQEHEAEIAQLIQHIHDKGPVRSADFEHPRKGASGWWEWKPHKRHLEGLFTAGKVMVIERRNFQRVYDLTHRVMPDWDDERCEVLAQEIYKLLLEHDMWIDVSIYYNGKRMSTSDGDNFRYNGPPFIEEDKNPKDYFEYVNDEHILSMSFDGPLYDALNGYGGWDGWDIEERFSNLLSKHGLYYELGNAWNLTLYKI